MLTHRDIQAYLKGESDRRTTKAREEDPQLELLFDLIDQMK